MKWCLWLAGVLDTYLWFFPKHLGPDSINHYKTKCFAICDQILVKFGFTCSNLKFTCEILVLSHQHQAKLEKGEMDNDTKQSLSMQLCARTTSDLRMGSSTYSRTPQGRWCITPLYNWITQPPEPGEVICLGGLERGGAGDCPETDSDTGQCFPHCLSASWKHRAAPILTRLPLFGTASSRLGDGGAQDKRTPWLR